jgi:multiple sugar transport system substrate-binding protein
MTNQLSRRTFLRMTGVTLAGAAIAACAVPTGPTGSTESGAAPAQQAISLSFWSMNYGDVEEWQRMFDGYAEAFKEESGGIDVTMEIINWAQSRDTYMLVSSGGDHPDAADMYWLYSHVQLGRGEFGPMPITDYKDLYWPDLEERFYEGALQDVFWQGEFYGIPWRGDIRPMLYRTDFLEEAGFSEPPTTWDEVVEQGKALTQRDASGNVTRWGVDFRVSGDQPPQGLLPLVWQAGGEFMNEDGTQATIDTEPVREALQFVHDAIWVHEITPPTLMDPSWNSNDEFIASRVAINTMVPDAVGPDLERLAPDLNGKWAGALPPGYKRIVSYSGAGYWLEISKYLNRVSGSKKVMADPFWQETQWRQAIVACLDYAHTSQHPSPAWAKLMLGNAGAVLYDMMQEAWIQRLPVAEVTARAQERMQAEMDAAMVQ